MLSHQLNLCISEQQFFAKIEMFKLQKKNFTNFCIEVGYSPELIREKVISNGLGKRKN